MCTTNISQHQMIPFKSAHGSRPMLSALCKASAKVTDHLDLALLQFDCLQKNGQGFSQPWSWLETFPKDIGRNGILKEKVSSQCFFSNCCWTILVFPHGVLYVLPPLELPDTGCGCSASFRWSPAITLQQSKIAMETHHKCVSLFFPPEWGISHVWF